MTVLFISFALWVSYLLYLWQWLKKDKAIYLIIAGIWLVANIAIEQVKYGTYYMIYGWLAVVAAGSLYIIVFSAVMIWQEILLPIISGEAD